MKPYLLSLALFIASITQAQIVEEIIISKELTPGWNLFGYLHNQNLPVDSALHTIWGDIDVVKNEDSFFFKAQPPHLNSLDTLIVGDGYFIHATNTCEYSSTILRYNYPPTQPILRTPEDDETNTDTTVMLTWESTDLENDEITYTVLFGTNWNPSTAIVENYSLCSIVSPNLRYETTYNWKVVANDGKNPPTTSPTFSFTVGNDPITEGTVTDIDGNVYNWKRFGNYKWMLQNLRVTHYGDGTPIPMAETPEEWVNLISSESGEACAFYDTTGTGYRGYSKETFGALYTWEAASHLQNGSLIQGACPYGWHLPYDGEWFDLEVAFGFEMSDVISSGWRGVCHGAAMSDSAYLWNDGPLETSECFGEGGFLSIPAGYMYEDGIGRLIGYHAVWWSCRATSENAIFRNITNNRPEVYRGRITTENGFSIRCVKDWN